MPLPYKGRLISYAKNLRKNATKQENRLWYDFLRIYPVRFQRQKAIGNYIVDFYCHRAKLAIELDGAQHYEENALEYDEKRTVFLNEYGIDVIRILNKKVDKKFEGVCIWIDNLVREKTNQPERFL